MNSVTIVICADFVVFRLFSPAVLLHKLTINYPHVLNYLKCLCKSEAKCEAIDMKAFFVIMQIKPIFTRKVLHLGSYF